MARRQHITAYALKGLLCKDAQQQTQRQKVGTKMSCIKSKNSNVQHSFQATEQSKHQWVGFKMN
jgi:hypothetical protein